MTTPAEPRDYGREAHEAAARHMDAIGRAFELELEGEDPEWPEDMAGPYDGCETCLIREVLHAAWPIMLEAARAETRGDSLPETCQTCHA